ncbi:MAG: type II toxin-antitoxin system tRNA(fMet)-specific endonuclease VapC [Gammaproteobacteria bacterium]
MGPRYLLDTNICIYVAKHRPAEVRRRFEACSPGDLAMSVVTYGELRHGAEKSQARDQALATLTALAETISVLALPAEAGVHYGEIRAALDRAGQPIGNNDLWIAAHALAAGLTLISNNLREFARIEGLSVENWA